MDTAPTGVCIVRVEHRDGGLRLSVLRTADVLADGPRPCLESRSVAEVLGAVEDFLLDFGRDTARAGRTGCRSDDVTER